MCKQRLRIAELFAGIGGVTGGFVDTDEFEPVFLNDSDEAARDAFILNFPHLENRYHVRRVQELTGPQLLDLSEGEIDGLLGCPPCQGLSAAGLRAQDDERNKLLYDFKRIIWSTRPKFFVLENVPRLLRSSLYEDFVDSISTRYSVHGEVLNAAEYGVPQLRRRTVVIGFRKDLEVPPSLPLPTHGGCARVFDYNSGSYVDPQSTVGRNALMLRSKVSLHRSRGLVTLEHALGDLPIDIAPGSTLDEYERPARTAYQERMREGATLLTNHRSWIHSQKTIELLRSINPGDCPVQHGGRSRNTKYFSQAYSRLHPQGLSRTITTNFHNPGSGRFTHYAAPRTLTVREALRIQGFPDTFNIDSTRVSDAKRLVGNAFPRPLAKTLAHHIYSLLLTI